MKATILGLYSHRETKVVYASLHVDGKVSLSASLDYCIGHCMRDGVTVTHAQDVLEWLRTNANFVGK